jgi:glycosyltransferase involved in cell wall biosynthesis
MSTTTKEIKVSGNMKISVLTPSFNSGKYIERAINSVLNQDYSNWEHIIVDGDSSDNTIEVLKKYEHLVWVSEKDKGQSDAMNKAFNMSSGDIIVYLNADDYFLPNVFKEIVKTFQETNAEIVVGDLKEEWADREVIRKQSANHGSILQYWKSKFPANPVSYFYLKEVQVRVGAFPLDNHYTMDLWFLFRAFENVKSFKLDKILGVFYLHEVNKTIQADTKKNMENEYRLYLKEKGSLSYLIGMVLFKIRNSNFRGKRRASKLLLESIIK